MCFCSRGMIFIALAFLSISNIAVAALSQAGEPGYIRRSGPVVVARSGEGVLWVRAGRHTVYKFRGEDERGFFLSIKYGEAGKAIYPAAGYIRVAGNPERVRIRFLDPADGEFIPKPVGSDEGDEMVLKRAGDVHLEVLLGELRAPVRLNVVELPFARNASAEAVISALGVPDETDRKVVMWPNDEWVDGIFYHQSDTSELVSGTHWYYEKYPHLALCIRNEKVVDIGFRDQPFGWEYHLEKDPDYLEEREWLNAPASVPLETRLERGSTPSW